VEVGTQFACRWRAFFTRLEHLHGLDRKDPWHLWLLHTLFLDLINTDCEIFADEWNHHPIRGPDSQDQTPSVCPHALRNHIEMVHSAQRYLI
jgi:hypothetical protein